LKTEPKIKFIKAKEISRQGKGMVLQVQLLTNRGLDCFGYVINIFSSNKLSILQLVYNCMGGIIPFLLQRDFPV
jgi:hypothetical protein